MSNKKHPNRHRYDPPDWFKQSHFGIFIHWGLYSVPAFAPADGDDYGTIIRTAPPDTWFDRFPYAEWYENSLRIEGSPVQAFHNERYGSAPYRHFAAPFRESARLADVHAWADCFCAAGASYVVIVTKHHDGFALWDTAVTNPHIEDYRLDFDFVGALADAVRGRGMRFGVYYSSLLDWTFTRAPITSPADLFLANDRSPEYRRYITLHWHELIDRYRPDILWNDIGYPHEGDLLRLFDYYYDAVPDGLVNDRWTVFPGWMHNRFGRRIVNRAAATLLQGGEGKTLEAKYYDYRTIEYSDDWNESDDYVEMCRGIDKSFAYNRGSRPDDFITPEDVRRLISTLETKKGRLLLGVGPAADGTIPEPQRRLLEELAHG